MKKNISINISGIIFHIEEDGYDVLRGYLDSINRYFSTFEDSAEILADIESRIAEIFLDKLKDGKQVITAEDVSFLMTTMGNVHDFEAAEEHGFEMPPVDNTQDEEEKTQAKTGSRRLRRDGKRKVLGGVCAGIGHYFNIDPVWIRILAVLLVLIGGITVFISGITIITYIVLWIAIPVSRDLEETTSRKMYRNPDNKVLGGVSSGIGAFFGVDLVVIRLLFVISIFLGGMGILLYIIMWIALPEAKTLTEKIQMQGNPVTLSNIESSVKKKLNEPGDSAESTLAKIILFPFRLIATVINWLARTIGPLFKVLLEAARIVAGGGITALGLIILLSTLVVTGVTLGFIVAPDFFSDSDTFIWSESSFPIASLKSTFTGWTMAFGLLAAVIPPIFLVLLGLSVIVKRIIFSPILAWTLISLFLVSLVFLAIGIPRIALQFSASGEHIVEQHYDFGQKTLVLKLNEVGMDGYDATKLRLKGYEGSGAKLIERFKAQGTTRKKAIENAQTVSYQVVQQDSILLFDSNVTFGESADFRAQRLNMELYIPYGTKFQMQEQLRNILRHDISFDDEDIFIMGQDGYECTTCELALKEYIDFKDDFSDFDRIELNGVYNAEIIHGEKYDVSFRGNKGVTDQYDISVRNDRLIVSPDFDYKLRFLKSLSKKRRLTIRVITPTLENIELNGAGNVDITGFSNRRMSIEVNGALKAAFDGDVEQLEIELNGSSSLTLEGKGKSLEVGVHGVSALRAYDYPVNTAIVSAHGVSSAKVYVTDRLEIDKTIGSSVDYRGNPDSVDEH